MLVEQLCDGSELGDVRAGPGHTVTIGRVGAGWHVEHVFVGGWRGEVCDGEQVARILADRERARVPGRSWLEFAVVE